MMGMKNCDDRIYIIKRGGCLENKLFKLFFNRIESVLVNFEIQN